MRPWESLDEASQEMGRASQTWTIVEETCRNQARTGFSLVVSFVWMYASCSVCHRVFMTFNSGKPSTIASPRIPLPWHSGFTVLYGHHYSIDLLLTALSAVTISNTCGWCCSTFFKTFLYYFVSSGPSMVPGIWYTFRNQLLKELNR